MTCGDEIESGFSAERLERLSEIEGWHFWFVGRRQLLDRLLKRYAKGRPQLVLDIGCGTAFTSRALAQHGHRVVALDRRPEGLRSRRQDTDAPALLQAEATSLPLRDSVFDVVMLLDVLEHVDDGAVLREVARVLRPDGLALVTVPALPWLWSYRDEAAGHLRRYTRQQLVHELGRARLQTVYVSFYECLLLPLVMLTRLFGRRGPGLRDREDSPHPLANALLLWINRLEVWLGSVIRWPIGSSLVVVCRKV